MVIQRCDELQRVPDSTHRDQLMKKSQKILLSIHITQLAIETLTDTADDACAASENTQEQNLTEQKFHFEIQDYEGVQKLLYLLKLEHVKVGATIT